jgi:hypothetical protein
MGPSVILDKSALEALSVDEAVWLEALLDMNVVPVFYVEVLADLEKQGRQGQPAEWTVARLAEKTPSNAYPNVDHGQIVLAELAGQKIEMTHRPAIRAGEVKRSSDGQIGVHVDEFPEQTALQRWQRHDFAAVERLVAKQWRRELAAQDLDQLVDLVKTILPRDQRMSNLGQLKTFIDEFCSSRDWKVIALALAVLGVPQKDGRAFRKRWENALKRPLDRFAPYTAHVFKVDLLLYLGIARGFISGDRASNKADMAYLYYLPFTMAFVSGDGLHRRTVPLFLTGNQSFLAGPELKDALRELDDHYDKLPEEVKALGVLSFASYPPSTFDNAVTRLWDQHMRPDWRQIAAEREVTLGAPRDHEADRRTLDELNAWVEEAETVSDAIQGGGAELDYAIRSRQVPAVKGKWRMVSTDVEGSGE